MIYDYAVYGMPIYKLHYHPYDGLYGNATRAFGIANNVSKTNHKVALVVQNGFTCQESPYISNKLDFIEESKLEDNLDLIRCPAVNFS